MGVKQKTKSLDKTNNPMADTFFQLQVLNGKELTDSKFTPFGQMIGGAITPSPVEIFQINIGKLCNQTCAHCHVDAGPDKRVENMDKATLERCLEIIAAVPTIHTVDITGGAPDFLSFSLIIMCISYHRYPTSARLVRIVSVAMEYSKTVFKHSKTSML